MANISDQERICIIMLSYCLGIGPMMYKKLIDQFKSPSSALYAPLPILEQTMGIKVVTELEQYRNIQTQKAILEDIHKKGIIVLTQDDDDYPELLKSISDPPICLYVRGDRKSLNILSELCIAVVGTRKPTQYGKDVARSFSMHLASSHIVVVSGLARGIDAASHEAALETKGRTIAVLGCGVDIVYPPEHRALYERIQKTGGLIISEFPPGHTVQKGLFIARNRVISGLSRGVVIVEGTQHSGTLITARYAAEQGRDVFAVPGSIFSSLSQAPHMLVNEGAHLVTNPAQITAFYQDS